MENVTSPNEYENGATEVTLLNVKVLATSYLMYKIGEIMNMVIFV